MWWAKKLLQPWVCHNIWNTWMHVYIVRSFVATRTRSRTALFHVFGSVPVRPSIVLSSSWCTHCWIWQRAMVFLRFPIFPFERALFAPSFLYLSSLFFSSWCAFWLRYCVARFAKNNVTKSSLKLRSLMIFTPGTSRHSTRTKKPKPKWHSLGVGRPKKGAFKRALFAPSFLLPSSLFFSSWCAFWLKFFAARFAK